MKLEVSEKKMKYNYLNSSAVRARELVWFKTLNNNYSKSTYDIEVEVFQGVYALAFKSIKTLRWAVSCVWSCISMQGCFSLGLGLLENSAVNMGESTG